MNSREFRERVLIALYREAMRMGVEGFYNPQDAARAAGLSWRPGQLRVAVIALEESSYLRLRQTREGGGYDGGMHIQLTQFGLEEAEDLIEQNIEYQEDEEETYSVAGFAPASDRYVSIAHNQQVEAAAELERLKEAVRGSNEASAEDRDIALYEIAVFEATLVEPRAAADLIDRFVNQVLKWLTRVFSAAAVAVVAERLVQALLPLLG